jgi:uncharacterized protein YndB with AHSA1/START domain
VGDEAVRRATGRGWDEWLKVLDRDGARTMSHTEIARLLHGKHKVGDWWSQMVTVGYELGRGLRAAHQRPSGYEVSRSRTVAASAARCFAAWASAASRRRWLADPGIVIRTQAKPQRLRFTWVDESSWGEARFQDKGGRTTVTVTHGKLRSARDARRLKDYWAAQLASLGTYVER